MERKGGLGQLSVPTLRITVTPVASASDVPQPPAEELFEREAMKQQQLEKFKAAAAAAAREAAARDAAAQQQQPTETLEMDEWLMDFAALFR
jgi:hypothetical protein